MNKEKVKFLLNWNHFSDHLSNCMTKLMTDSTFSDIIITTADKHMIYSHRFVLAYSSKYFQRLLKHLSKKKSDHLVVALPEIKYDIFKILMNYMYKGETQVPHELLPSVLKAGRFLEINGLINLNDIDNNSCSDSSSHYAGSEESHDKLIHMANNMTNSGRETPKRLIHPKLFSREITNSNMPNVSRVEATPPKRQTKEEHQTEENVTTADNSPTKSLQCKIQSEESKNFVPLSLKRKPPSREYIKRTPSRESLTLQSSESPAPKKLQKDSSVSTELFDVKIKEEIDSSPSSTPENVISNEDQITLENITIKKEDSVEMELYNKLRCEICKEDYTNPSDWVKHMTEKHKDKGYLAYQMMKNVPNNGLIKCVICSCACFSTAEWVLHFRKWHTEKDTGVTNKGERRTSNRIKRKIESDQDGRCNSNSKENDLCNTRQ